MSNTSQKSQAPVWVSVLPLLDKVDKGVIWLSSYHRSKHSLCVFNGIGTKDGGLG